jgi:hypothetical protein
MDKKLQFLIHFLAPGSGSGIQIPNPDPQCHSIRIQTPAYLKVKTKAVSLICLFVVLDVSFLSYTKIFALLTQSYSISLKNTTTY